MERALPAFGSLRASGNGNAHFWVSTLRLQLTNISPSMMERGDVSPVIGVLMRPGRCRNLRTSIMPRDAVRRCSLALVSLERFPRAGQTCGLFIASAMDMGTMGREVCWTTLTRWDSNLLT